uniref:MULE transposase domain-containing protein n=1 Tax=Latimeria chalumnae TaxID=7897 RepID=H3A845_LATCH
MVELERAAINTFRLIFPTVALSACFFHLSQCVWQKVQELRLRQEYIDNEEMRTIIKMLPALAFVPPGDVTAAFENIYAPDNLIPLLDYFEDTFVGRLHRGHRSRPLFPVELWNICNRVCEGLPRSNNLMEGWHSVFNQSVSVAHPSIYALIKQFKKEQKHTENLLVQIHAGKDVSTNPKKKYVRLTNNLTKLVQHYDPNDKEEFFKRSCINLLF